MRMITTAFIFIKGNILFHIRNTYFIVHQTNLVQVQLEAQRYLGAVYCFP